MSTSTIARAATAGPPGDTAPTGTGAEPLSPESPPPWQRLALEPVRSAAELATLLASPIYYGIGVPRGDGHPVLLVPGFLGSAGYLTILAGWLARIGYRPADAGIALNAGHLPTLLQQVELRAEDLSAAERRITIIGHSLGGLFARIIAVRRPDLVARVVTLGAPIAGHPRDAPHPLVQGLAQLLLDDDADGDSLAPLAAPLPPGVHLASLYSRQDGIIDWRTCLDPDPRAVNLEVTGSHTGLVWNTGVYQHLARLLPLRPATKRPTTTK